MSYFDGQHCTVGYFPQRVLCQFRHTQNYTSPGEAIDRRPIFSRRHHSSTLLVRAGLSWKGKKSSSSEGLAKQDKLTITSNYDSWWECACPLSLCPRSSRLLESMVNLLSLLRISCLIEKMAPLVQINESNPMRTHVTSSWTRLKLNWLDGWASWWNSRRRMLIQSQRMNSQNIFHYLFLSWHEEVDLMISVIFQHFFFLLKSAKIVGIWVIRPSLMA
ncbi:hypothetical protein AMTRI_Chr02g260330 [Amborella trichopoda]